ncbi:MAG: hypothetical protein K2X66_02070 [Cyanobacteria bacterium]|nr:hypothetical protein [Cyanobacteriota bacterium]
MLSILPSIFKPTKFHSNLKTPLTSIKSQFKAQHLHFAGDAHEIFIRLNPAKPEISPDEFFKTTCDTVVWQKDGETINVAEMIAFLCRIRRNDNYYGRGSAETLAKKFPGMDEKKLEKAFQALHEYTYLGRDRTTNSFWLRPLGLEMLQNLYPNVKLPFDYDMMLSEMIQT